jgi:riboflavin synthase
MFTGIISAIGEIIDTRQEGDLTIAIACPWDDLRIGESVACNGVCLTVVDGEDKAHQPPTTNHQPHFTAQLSPETTARTAPRWNAGDKINLERALKMGDRLDGHLVTGHVDGIAVIKNIEQAGDSHILALEAPPALARFIAEKGSITLDGVSITVNQVDGARFWVNIIPHTWRETTLGLRKPGDALNLEIDLMARYAARLMQA